MAERKAQALHASFKAALDRTRLLYRRTLPEQTRRQVRSTLRYLRKRRTARAPSPAPVHHLTPQSLTQEAKDSLAKWQLSQALEKAEAALKVAPDHQRALQLRVTILGNLGEIERARAAVRDLIDRYPLDVFARRQMKALDLDPPAPSRDVADRGIRRLGMTASKFVIGAQYLYEVELFEDSLDLCSMGFAAVVQNRSEAARQRDIGNLTHSKALALEALHRYEEAIQVYEGLVILPAFAARAAAGMARCHLEMGAPEKSEMVLRASNCGQEDKLPFSPLALDVLQAQGKILESYQLYRKKPISLALAGYFDVPQKPVDLNISDPGNSVKKALILAEGGPGDELRLASTYTDLSKCFGNLTITCDPRLHRIMERSFPKINFLPSTRYRREFMRGMEDRKLLTDATLFQCLSDDAIRFGRNCDLVCSLLDTLADLRPSREAFQKAPPLHLKPNERLAREWKEKVSDGKISIGIAWRSMLQSVARNRHYLLIENLRPLASITNAEFWLLQPKLLEEELQQIKSFLPVRVPEGLDLVDDIEGQLALTVNLDWVISPFTTTGELAGAVGVNTILVSTARQTLWRRSEDGSDLWHKRTKIVHGTPIYDRQSALREVANIINAMEITSKNSQISERLTEAL